MNDETTLTPTRPYMVRAIYQWLEDNLLTPHIMVDTSHGNVQVPTEHVRDDRIVLNIASQAVGNMRMDNDYIHFNARFAGASKEIWIPMQAVMGIYAKENQQGMFFDPTEYDDYDPSLDNSPKTDKSATPKPKRENKAGLKILK